MTTKLISGLIIILLLPGLVSAIEIDAEIIMPDYIPPTIYTTPPEIISDPIIIIEPFDNLTYFLKNDSTSGNKYIKGEYMCMDFSIDLAINLTNAGYDVGVVLIPGHALVWVTMPIPYDILYIEPQKDTIHPTYAYNGKEITIESACRLRSDMHMYGQY